MRVLALGFSSALAVLAACSSRQLDVEVDYTEEVLQICDAMCEKSATCEDPPFVEYDECMEKCTVSGGLHEDSACGQAFRDFVACLGGTANCEEYLDTRNNHAEDFTCKEENLHAAELKCGAQEGG